MKKIYYFIIILFTGFWIYPQVIQADCILGGDTCSHGTDCCSGLCSTSSSCFYSWVYQGSPAGYYCPNIRDGLACISHPECSWASNTCYATHDCSTLTNLNDCQINNCSWLSSISICSSIANNSDLIPPTPGTQFECTQLTTQTECESYSSICSWNQGPYIGCNMTIVSAPPPDNTSCAQETCSGLFDIYCNAKNLFCWIFTDNQTVLNNYLSQDVAYATNIFPISYITRFINILNNTNSVEPPGISYTPGTAIASTGITGTYTFNIFDHVDTIATIYEDTNGGTRNIWDIFMPYWNWVVNISLFFVCIVTALPVLGHIFENKDGLDQNANKKTSTDDSDKNKQRVL